MTGPSFLEQLRVHAPESLPVNLPRDPAQRVPADLRAPHGTTIIAFTWADGVLLAGDRRATSGNVIAQKDLVKVMAIDDTSAAGFAGSVGHALLMLKMFAAEVEQYEKVEGSPISQDGKIRRLSTVVRENLGAAMQGFVALPLFVGYDPADADPARIVTFDPSGSIARNRSGYTSIGSGSYFAEASLKKLHRPDTDRSGAISLAVNALWDAADDDTATAGPDLTRGLFPNLITVTAAGAEEVDEAEVRTATEAMLAARAERPGG
ncbi:Proteasome subunit beta, bacterial [Pseudonocardia sp. Ae168_Ps1]|uniref:proteasome subunit beta n=1 Tax=unclassified Pseudonocardia TaxID=2619320 RepID=UPI0001FFDD1E|nr:MULTISPECIES: proteasome subunit beta [unclassified Pseudonocardia]ALE75008.1 proteasome subunit beta [Pseudonocardia sp. EC080625-04]ALL74356.1 proteasome subunit beta [Pseudonocardia sp. EC080610-09]ALL81380.1 proteasome subunit beta [Pseudonocardia sp. EC080619-01]OLL75677.1 Proteasome subunit beta, bacterial [Pseudonocardia sp. Ae150A_Ps1]OLL81676.1 Proteasome subunit beta, bacterial [Pseudonocardia sp. Ae168_Ps1]